MKNKEVIARLRKISVEKKLKDTAKLDQEADARAEESVNILMEAWSAAFRSSDGDRALAKLLAATSYRNGYLQACWDAGAFELVAEQKAAAEKQAAIDSEADET